MQLIGYIDGVEVKFNFTPPNKFTADIPRHMDGTYILQLKAIDKAGNASHYSNIFIKIDFKQLNIKILSPEYEVIQNSEDFSFFQNNPELDINILNTCFGYIEVNGFYHRELVLC